MNLREYLEERYPPVVPDSDGHVKITCPKCGHHACIVNLNRGVLFCHLCEFGRGLRPEQFWSQVGVTVDGGVPVSPVSVSPDILARFSLSLYRMLRLSSDDVDYTYNRGVTFPSNRLLRTSEPFIFDRLLKTGWDARELWGTHMFRVDPNTGTIVSCPFLYPGRLLIFYAHDPEDPSTIYGMVSRKPSNIPDHLNMGGLHRYLAPKGASSGTWLYRSFPASVEPEAVVITEGELAALVAWSYGIPTLGQRGVAIGTKTVLSTLDALQPDRVYICYDQDEREKTAETVTKKAHKLAKRIPFPTRVVSLPRNEGKVDLDSYLRAEYGREWKSAQQDFEGGRGLWEW